MPPLGLRTQLVVMLRRARLDRRLLSGEDPAAESSLALRAHQLLNERARRRLAEALERRIVAARETRAARSAAVPVDRLGVLRTEPVLRRIAERLRAPGPLHPAGLIELRRLLSDAAGPLYAPAEEGHLLRVALEIEYEM